MLLGNTFSLYANELSDIESLNNENLDISIAINSNNKLRTSAQHIFNTAFAEFYQKNISLSGNVIFR